MSTSARTRGRTSGEVTGPHRVRSTPPSGKIVPLHLIYRRTTMSLADVDRTASVDPPDRSSAPIPGQSPIYDELIAELGDPTKDERRTS